MWVICPLMLNTLCKCIWPHVLAVYSTLLRQIGKLETIRKTMAFVAVACHEFRRASAMALGMEISDDQSVHCFCPD